MPNFSRTVQARRDYLEIWLYIARDSISAAHRKRKGGIQLVRVVHGARNLKRIFKRR